MLPLLSPDGATPLWLIRGPPEWPFLPWRPYGPAAPKAAAQASTGCGSEVTASQVNRLWQSFHAQGPTELSQLPSRYLSVPGYPILLSQTSGPTYLYHTRGLNATSFPKVLFAVAFAVSISYRGLELPQSPVSNGILTKCERNAAIRQRHQQGESYSTLANVFGISEQRIHQIVHDRRK